MRTPLLAVALLGLTASAWAAPAPATHDPSTCAEAWREARASGARESQAAYVQRCKTGRSEVAATTSFPGAARADLNAPAPPAPAASGGVPGPMPQGATALCKDGSYSTAQRHVDACAGSGGVQQLFKSPHAPKTRSVL